MHKSLDEEPGEIVQSLEEEEEIQPLSWYWRGLQPYRGKLKARGSSGKGKKLQAVLSCRHQYQGNLLYAYQG